MQILPWGLPFRRIDYTFSTVMACESAKLDDRLKRRHDLSGVAGNPGRTAPRNGRDSPQERIRILRSARSFRGAVDNRTINKSSRRVDRHRPPRTPGVVG